MDKQPDLVIPWVFAVQLMRMHLSAVLFKTGKTPEEIRKLIDDSLPNNPTPELHKLVQALLDEAGVEYAKQLAKKVTPANVLQLKPLKS